MMNDLHLLGNTENEIFSEICLDAAMYITGGVRPAEELQTDEQQKESMNLSKAIYKFQDHFNHKVMDKDINLLTDICRSAARYIAGIARPSEELQTSEQQNRSNELALAIYDFRDRYLS